MTWPPAIHLKVDQVMGTAYASGVARGIPWVIRSIDGEDECSASAVINVDNERVAQIIVHTGPDVNRAEEVQAVAGALVWSALRAAWWRRLETYGESP